MGPAAIDSEPQAYLNVLCGLPDNGQVRITQIEPTVEFLWDGAASFMSQIALQRPWVRVWVGPAAPRDVTLWPGPVINNIADPDICGHALGAASSVARQVPRPWFNHPDRVRATTRDRVSEVLQGIPGVTAPRVVRSNATTVEGLRAAISESGLGYPVLSRSVGSHRGRSLVRIDGADDDGAFLACLSAGAELYLCPFVDFAGADGLYRKHRVAVIGGEPILNSLVTGAHWKVHAGDRIWNAATIAAEQAALNGFATGLGVRFRAQLAEIHRRLGLDYFGMDFAITPDGSMLVFEANAVMQFLGPSTLEPDIWAASGQAIEAALLRLLDQPERWFAAGPDSADALGAAAG